MLTTKLFKKKLFNLHCVLERFSQKFLKRIKIDILSKDKVFLR
ncbi:hypothetical protein LEP1GSC186_2503 [Leptospira noguchii serovar Autumnalis str. ZUN142]|uniref:Uncharacterized protein n=1 Tax=Leptospira noguchii serovar Autumnalis str. ZUN142 TaxID=1085540 RepID=M6UDQ5_9LEPT|nr:hypothetical protein LEP1GSC186_2503 [Leptospira noguchii serovar Autumnalis str. ZUN142]